MRVEIDYEVALALCILRETGIEIPDRLLYDLAENQLGSVNSAGALGMVTAQLFEKWEKALSDPENTLEVFPQTFDLLFRATRDAFDEMHEQMRFRWKGEMKRRKERTEAALRREKAQGDVEERDFQGGGPMTDEVRRRHDAEREARLTVNRSQSAKRKVRKKKRAQRAA